MHRPTTGTGYQIMNSDNPSDDTNKPPQQGRSRDRERQGVRRTQQRRGRHTAAAELTNEVVARFAACGRCSFFLTEYRLSYRPEAFAAAVAHIEQDWLTLEWDSRLRQMVSDAYGSRFDIETFHFEGCCPECRRAFVYRGETEDEPAVLRIAV